jgi:hypothetical protein
MDRIDTNIHATIIVSMADTTTSIPLSSWRDTMAKGSGTASGCQPRQRAAPSGPGGLERRSPNMPSGFDVDVAISCAVEAILFPPQIHEGLIISRIHKQSMIMANAEKHVFFEA